MQFLLSLLIALILGVVALAFVLYPFYRRTPTQSEKQREAVLLQWTAESEPESLIGRNKARGAQSAEVEQREEGEQAARTALHEIELDYQLGNISESDYRTLRERYLQRALVALKSRYDREQEQELDDAIEVQLQKMKEHNDNVE